MKISYRREMKHNYLIMDPEELNWHSYEYKMLSENTIRGILQFQFRQMDEEIRFYYEITSRQPLSRMLESHLLRESELRQLILGISGALDRMEQYLLRENIVLLEPDYIYIDPEDFQIWLCLVPGLDRDFPYDYGKLLEYLLGKIDHQDKDSVVLAYALYQETRKENYGMDDILRLIGRQKQKTTEMKEAETKETEMREAEPRYEIRQMQKPEVCEMQTQKEKKGIWSRLRRWWRSRKQIQEEESVSQDTDPAMWKTLFRDEMEEERTLSDVVGMCDTEHNTTLLADLSAECDHVGRRLCARDPRMEDIEISYYPFIIGKQENLVDYCLKHETVSRFHVRIDEKDGEWTIQDLNSANGTTVAGQMLENNEEVPLHLNDEIRIADLCYRFM